MKKLKALMYILIAIIVVSYFIDEKRAYERGLK